MPRAPLPVAAAAILLRAGRWSSSRYIERNITAIRSAGIQIETQELTTCEVASDGCAISLGFVDGKGEPATIRLSINQVGALVMTLPGLISKALQTRFGDQTLRYAYPLDSWVIEQSTDPAQGMMTLKTSDGFSVCFSIPRAQQSELGEALVATPAAPLRVRAN
ncbi:hypothetical protein ABIE91_005414 [Bradyrhizobium elkanii]